MIFLNEKRINFNKAIKNKDLIAAFSAIAQGYESSPKQDLKMFALQTESNIFSCMDTVIKKGEIIPDKYLALATICFNRTYSAEISYGTYNKKPSNRFPDLQELYNKKVTQPEYRRRLFLEWQKLFKDMIFEKTTYKSNDNHSTFNRSAHFYEEHVIESSAFHLKDILFKEASKEEILEIISQCQFYPKKPYGKNAFERQYNIQYSRYQDVQRFSRWLSENILLENMIKNNKTLNIEIPTDSKGVIEEIKLFYLDINKDKNLLEPQDELLFEKLYNQRLFELLDKYQDLDQKYDNLTNKNNLNANEILQKSLIDIRDIFEDFYNKVNLKKVENLSFQLRLTREFIKNSF